MKSKGIKFGALLAVMLMMSMALVPAVSAESASKKVGPFSGVEMPEELKNAVQQVDSYTFVSGAQVPDKEAFKAAWEAYEETARSEYIVTTSAVEDSGTDIATKNLFDSYIEGETYFHGICDAGFTTVTFAGDGHTKDGGWAQIPIMPINYS